MNNATPAREKSKEKRLKKHASIASPCTYSEIIVESVLDLVDFVSEATGTCLLSRSRIRFHFCRFFTRDNTAASSATTKQKEKPKKKKK